jgi:hypothetical protein
MFKKFHSSSEMAFRNHCDYACTVTVYQQSRVGWWVLAFIVLVLLCVSAFR